MQFQINYMAVAAAAVINMLVGYAWFGPLFGKAWLKTLGMSKDQMKAPKGAEMAKIYGVAVISALIMAYVLVHFIEASGGATSASTGAIIGFWAWLGFVATTTLGGVLWEKKSLTWFLITASYYLVVLVINGALLAVWL